MPLFVRGHVEPSRILIEVGATQMRVKENARIARVRIFRIDGTNAAASRKSNSKKPKPAKKKKVIGSYRTAVGRTSCSQGGT